MTEAEKNEIVGLVMTQISSQAVDFDIATEQPQANDLLTAVRETESGGYRGVTIKWDDVARIATELANQAATRAEQAETDANNILERVQSKGTEITNFVATSKTELETQKNESVNAVKSVYQTDLNELKGDIDTERNARIEADTDHSTRLQKVELASSVNRYEIDNLKAKAEGKLYRTETVEAEAYTVDVPSSVAPYAEVQKIKGKSVVWNQINNLEIKKWIISQLVVTNLESGYTRLTYVNGTETYGYIFFNKGAIIGHTYLMLADLSIKDNSNIELVWAKPSNTGDIQNFNNGKLVGKVNSSGNPIIGFSVRDKSIETSIDIKDIMIVDLTKMFGSGNEPTLEECNNIFSEGYYPYDAGTIKSFPVRTVRSLNAERTEIGSMDVSSVTSDFKSVGSVHDEWSNGKIIRRVGSRSYTSGDESESGYITDGKTTYYPLDTPIEETVPEIDNYINVEDGGTLTFESDDAVNMPIPSTTRFVVDLTSTTEETT